MKTSVIGYPRIGKNRELKFASEKFFRSEITEVELLQTAAEIRKENLLNQWHIYSISSHTDTRSLSFPI